MKITPTMVSAGVDAIARAHRAKPQDSGLVTIVFDAMWHAYEKEQKRLQGLDKPKPYEHQDWPKWVKGPEGESRIFDKAEDVPEGWGAALPPEDNKSKLVELRAEYKAKFGKGPFMGWNMAQLLEKIANGEHTES